MRVAIWLDDVRNPASMMWKDRVDVYASTPDQVIWAKTFEEFTQEFTRVRQDPDLELVAVFFDNDLGKGKEGRHAFTWMEGEVREHNMGPFVLHAQTANLAARKELRGGFQSLHRFWQELV